MTDEDIDKIADQIIEDACYWWNRERWRRIVINQLWIVYHSGRISVLDEFAQRAKEKAE